MKMTCGRIDRLISAYLDGELSGADMMLVREHIRSCKACEADLESEKRVKRVLGGLNPVKPSAGFEARLLGSLTESQAPWSQRLQHWMEMSFLGRIEPARAAVYGCAALLLVVLGHLPQNAPWSPTAPAQMVSLETAFHTSGTAGPVLTPISSVADAHVQPTTPWQQPDQYSNGVSPTLSLVGNPIPGDADGIR
ncbi:MAG: anti-sigma factor [Armatimonadota bacterium]